MQKNHYVDQLTVRILLCAVFLLSFSLLGFQIALTRLLSVMLSYHYVFAVVSLAMLGLGLGGIFIHFLESKMVEKYNRHTLLVLSASLCSLTMAFSVMAVMQAESSVYTSNIIFLCWFVFCVPFLFGGAVMSQIFRIYPVMSAKIYAADLVGAATGCIGVIFALDIFGGVSSIFLFAVITSITAMLFTVNGRQESG
ncbi:MAG TPA: hypothetical protein PKZ42_07510 [Syntrophales bacterium]|mgnify:CR=1 FL=1|nr:hypothetical protein [Syntrophales bacterium]